MGSAMTVPGRVSAMSERVIILGPLEDVGCVKEPFMRFRLTYEGGT
jgi:hypothetical protein